MPSLHHQQVLFKMFQFQVQCHPMQRLPQKKVQAFFEEQYLTQAEFMAMLHLPQQEDRCQRRYYFSKAGACDPLYIISSPEC